MLSDGTLSVISRIRHAWEPATAACKQHVGPEALRGLSSSLISSRVDLIVAEYDVIADRLGRSFVHGDGESKPLRFSEQRPGLKRHAYLPDNRALRSRPAMCYKE